MCKKILFVVAIVTFIFSSAIASATSVVQIGLEGMSHKAGDIFHGVCENVDVVQDERGLVSTEVTYKIFRSVKGSEGETIKFKIFGAAIDTGSGSPATTVAGMTRFYPGKEDVLFLYKASPWGFTSPVGMWQGDFPVIREPGKEARLNKDSGSYKNAVSRRGAKAASGKRKKQIVTPDDLLDEVEEILD